MTREKKPEKRLPIPEPVFPPGGSDGVAVVADDLKELLFVEGSDRWREGGCAAAAAADPDCGTEENVVAVVVSPTPSSVKRAITLSRLVCILACISVHS